MNIKLFVFIFSSFDYSILLKHNRTLAKIADFGTSRKLQTNATKPTRERGTVQYIAPEVIRGEHYNRSCDVYSFGIMLWEMLTRRRPYGGMNDFQVYYQVGTSDLRPTLDESISHEFQRLIERYGRNTCFW